MVADAVYEAEDVAQHNHSQSAWIIMENKVYDVTKFLMEHPGGEEVILEYAGKDATDAFNDVGHSSDAKQMAEDYLIGKLPPKEVSSGATEGDGVKVGKDDESFWTGVLLSPTWTNLLIPVGISVAVYVAFRVANQILNSHG